MSPPVEAALIAGIVSLISLGGTVVVAVIGFRTTRSVTGSTLAEQRTRTLNERFATAAEQLGSDKPSAVRLAGVYAMAGLADDWAENRQTCVDVLCAYLRMPYEPDPGDEAPPEKQLDFRTNREVRHTVIRVINAHLRDNAGVSWRGLNFDFTGAAFDGGDFRDAVFSGGIVNFTGAKFCGGEVDFTGTVFSGGKVELYDAEFSGGIVYFADSLFSGCDFHGNNVKFSGGNVSFNGAEFSGGYINLDGAEFSGGKVGFGAGFSGSKVQLSVIEVSGGELDFSDASFSGGEVGLGGALFSGGTVDFSRAKFSGGAVDFHATVFSGGTVDFSRAKFSGGAVDFDEARFSGSEISFNDAQFSSGTVDFRGAQFCGGTVDFSASLDWSCPPKFPWTDTPPPGVKLPKKENQSQA